jgi:hypothetical protein
VCLSASASCDRTAAGPTKLHLVHDPAVSLMIVLHWQEGLGLTKETTSATQAPTP